MIRLLVIVVVYNGMKWLDKCLRSVITSTQQADLYIVDNGSTDGSIEYIKHEYPLAKLIESNENLGFGKANNIGFEYALENGYDFVYLLNQDAWVEDDLFETMIKVSLADSSWGILSPLQENREKTKLDKNFSKCCELELLSDCLCKRPLKKAYEVEFVMAAHWLLPIETIKVVGAFSPIFYHYGEDNNYADRTIYFGKKIGIVPSCTGVHDREFRKSTRAKEQYFNYICNLIMLSNPKQRNYYIGFLSSILRTLFATPKNFNIKYLFRILFNLNKIIKHRKQSRIMGAFLNTRIN